MKNYTSALLIATIVLASIFETSCTSSSHITTENTVVSTEIGFNSFHDELAPYGHWAYIPSYGQVWMSNTQGFVPYSTGGHWAYTSYGWTWASDYAWGWAPFHYGRWAFEGGFGWVWVPGYEWAPAWVAWRSGYGHFGWAPLSPGLNVDVAAGFGAIPSQHWMFVPQQYITNNHVNNYIVNNTQNTSIINNTTIINNTNIYNNHTKYVTGPGRQEVEKATGSRITPLQVKNVSKPGATSDSKSISLYRPEVKKGSIEEANDLAKKNSKPVEVTNKKSPENNNANPAIPPKQDNSVKKPAEDNNNRIPDNNPPQTDKKPVPDKQNENKLPPKNSYPAKETTKPGNTKNDVPGNSSAPGDQKQRQGNNPGQRKNNMNGNRNPQAAKQANGNSGNGQPQHANPGNQNKGNRMNKPNGPVKGMNKKNDRNAN